MKIKIKRYPYWHNYFVKLLKKDIDVSIVITGPRGLGKSTLTMWLMIWTEARLNSDVAEVEPLLESLTWDVPKWISMMKETYKYRAIGFEEFGNAATVEEVNSTINQMLREIQSTNRHLRILKIFNLPGFVHMPPKIRITTNFWINILQRGWGVLYKVVPEEGPDQRPTHFYKYQIGNIQYKALPAEIYKLYEDIKKETERKRYEQAKVIVEANQFRKLPLMEKKRKVASLLYEMKDYLEQHMKVKEEKDGKIIRVINWSIASLELANRYGISISSQTLRRWFHEIFVLKGWDGIKAISI